MLRATKWVDVVRLTLESEGRRNTSESDDCETKRDSEKVEDTSARGNKGSRDEWRNESPNAVAPMYESKQLQLGMWIGAKQGGGHQPGLYSGGLRRTIASVLPVEYNTCLSIVRKVYKLSAYLDGSAEPN